jgi:hypothetical protein
MRSRTTSSPSSVPAMRPPRGRLAGRSTAWPIRQADREKVEAEIDEVIAREPDPVKWLDQMPWTRAVFEEAMRLYPPAPSINRAAITDDSWQDEKGETVTIEAGTTVLVMPWTLHRHTLLWDRPEAFIPSRFLPENRGIDRPLPVSALRRRSADMHRRDLRAARGGDRAGCAFVGVSLRLCRGNQALAGAEAYHPTRRWPADACQPSLEQRNLIAPSLKHRYDFG